MKLAQNIIVIENGEVIEHGSHDELISIKGNYFSLYKKQIEEEKRRKT